MKRIIVYIGKLRIRFAIVFGVTLGLLNGPQTLKGQDSAIVVTQQYWFDVNPAFGIGKRLDFYGDLTGHFVHPNEWSRYIIGPALRYRPVIRIGKTILETQIHAGVRFLYTNNIEHEDVAEIRPFQGLRVRWPSLDNLFFRHYLRLEERFQSGVNSGNFDFGMRVRYMLDFNLNFTGNRVSFMKNFFFPASAEVFGNFNSSVQFNDVLRVNMGLGYELNNQWNISLHLAYHYTRDPVKGQLETNDIVYRLRFIRKLYGSSDN